MLRKGTITRRGGLPTFKPTGLAPQKAVSGLTNNDPTRDTYQRKVFYDGTNFFVVYLDSANKQVKYVASSDGITWTSAIVLWTYSVGPYFGGNIDVQYPNRGAKDVNGASADLSMVFSGSNGTYFYWYPFTISGQVLNALTSSTIVASDAQGGSVVANINSLFEHLVYHRSAYLNLGRVPSFGLNLSSTDVSYGGTTTGGSQVLPYQTSGDYDIMVLAKGGDNKLYYNTAYIAASPYAWRLANFAEIATLGTGFSDFCSCSEAQNVGDPERIHIVYVKSTGELCHRKFENDALGSETVLVSSGASYPVIACGADGRLYVFYVKDAKIYVIHFKGGWQNPVGLFTAEHAYDTPTYLSCSQNVQSGKICLVWCEAEDSTFAVWFCYLED